MGDEVLTDEQTARLREYEAERAKEIAELQALWPVTWLRESMIVGAHSVLYDHTGWSGCEGDFHDGGRQLAALALREAMSHLSEIHDCSSWGMGISEQHWQWLRGVCWLDAREPSATSLGHAVAAVAYTEELACIRKLAEASGWWWADHDVAVPLKDWAARKGELPPSPLTQVRVTIHGSILNELVDEHHALESLTRLHVDVLLDSLIKAGHLPAMAVAVDRAQHDGKSAEGYRDASDVEVIERVFVDLCEEEHLEAGWTAEVFDGAIEHGYLGIAVLASRIPAERRRELILQMLREQER